MAGKRPYTPKASTVSNKILRLTRENGKRFPNPNRVKSNVEKMTAAQRREVYAIDDWEDFLELDIADDDGDSLTRYH